MLLGAGVPLLQACGGDDDERSQVRRPTIADGLEPEKGPLRIINYADYVNLEVIADFEAKYGVKVEITTIDTDTEAITKLASGAIKADVHHSMAGTSIGNLIAGGLIQPLNKSYIPNFANVIETFNDPWYDPGATYSVPYTFFGTGIGYPHRPHRPGAGGGAGLGHHLERHRLQGPGVGARRRARGVHDGDAAQGRHRRQHHRPEDHRPGTRRRDAS